VLMPASRLSLSLFHRLIPVTILSTKVPSRGCVFKESVKVRTPKSPSFSDDFSPDFAPFYVLPYTSCTQTQHFRCLTDGEKVLSNRLRRYSFFVRHSRLPLINKKSM
jgi:hypothetical protein